MRISVRSQKDTPKLRLGETEGRACPRTPCSKHAWQWLTPAGEAPLGSSASRAQGNSRKGPLLTGYGGSGRKQWSWGVRLARASGSRGRDDFLHQGRLLGTAVLFTLLPLSIVVVKRRREDSIWEHPTAERQPERQPSSEGAAPAGPSPQPPGKQRPPRLYGESKSGPQDTSLQHRPIQGRRPRLETPITSRGRRAGALFSKEATGHLLGCNFVWFPKSGFLYTEPGKDSLHLLKKKTAFFLKKC